MKNKNESFKEFKEKVLHKKDDLFAILFLDPIAIRLAYFIKKHNLNISPNQITLIRLILIAPLIIFCLLLAPFLQLKIFYFLALFFSYFFLLSDWCDGSLARGKNITSARGAFLDSVADRWMTIICFVTIFSIGMYFSNFIILYGAIVLFVLKTFHMMIITKVFYYGREKGENNQKVFAGEDAKQLLGITIMESFLRKINSILKIKRWSCTFGGSERYFMSIMFLLMLVVLNLKIMVFIFSCLLIFLYGVSFIIRIKNLLK